MSFYKVNAMSKLYLPNRYFFSIIMAKVVFLKSYNDLNGSKKVIIRIMDKSLKYNTFL